MKQLDYQAVPPFVTIDFQLRRLLVAVDLLMDAFNGVNAWIPSSNINSNDYLQIDLGSVYFVCGVATQGNPSAG